MRNRPRNSIRINGLLFDETNSLNLFFLCICGRKFRDKTLLKKHVKSCDGKSKQHYCRWCKLTFQNRGNLVRHARDIHSDFSYEGQAKPKKFKCDVCEAKYDAMWKLKHHIRREHFNLTADLPRFETEPVNQVWFEKVLNSENLVKMKKTGPNTLVMKGITPTTDIKVDNTQPVKVDLHDIYPTGSKQNSPIPCNICKKSFVGRDMKKHVEEAHLKDFYKHRCNSCGTGFKRAYIFMKHVCHKPDGRMKKRKLEGVAQFGRGGITISNVTSLHPIVID